MEIYSFGGDIHENCNFLIGFVFVSKGGKTKRVNMWWT